MDTPLSRALVAELIGTFALVFVGAGAAATGIGGVVGIAFAHGLVIVAFAYAYGHISGTHINPAVTAGVWIAGKIPTGRAVAYWVVQILGGVLAGYALYWFLGGAGTGLGTTLPVQGLEVRQVTIDISPLQALVLEALLTFFLANTVLNADVGGKGGALAGLAVGMTLTLSILVAGPLTGASLNPSRSIGPALASGQLQHLWLYFVGPIAGGLVAGLLYRGFLEER